MFYSPAAQRSLTTARIPQMTLARRQTFRPTDGGAERRPGEEKPSRARERVGEEREGKGTRMALETAAGELAADKTMR